MARGQAWILALGGPARVAIGERELVHLAYDVPSSRVPYAPPYCSRVCFWEGRALPVLDLAVRAGVASAALDIRFAAVVGYRNHDDAFLQYGVLPLRVPPMRVEVNDWHACELPAALAVWRPFAVSCFLWEGLAVPVVDLRCAFAPPGGSGVPRTAPAVGTQPTSI
jgi:hypothetical protein